MWEGRRWQAQGLGGQSRANEQKQRRRENTPRALRELRVLQQVEV